MNCGECLASSVELVELGADMVCPRCQTDYTAWRRTLPTLAPDPHAAYNARTRKLIPKGDAYRDRLVSARLSLRSNA